jgi:hypothetical protein
MNGSVIAITIDTVRSTVAIFVDDFTFRLIETTFDDGIQHRRH